MRRFTLVLLILMLLFLCTSSADVSCLFICSINGEEISEGQTCNVHGDEVLSIIPSEGYIIQNVQIAEWTDHYTYGPEDHDTDTQYDLWAYPADTEVLLTVTVSASKGNEIHIATQRYRLLYPEFHEFSFKEAADGVTMVGYNGNGWRVDIPAEYANKRVTGIGEEAFFNSQFLTAVNVPESVERIGQYAFSCTTLMEISLPASLKAIDQGVFSGCDFLKRIEIPEGVKEIPAFAFYGCEKLESIVIPGSVQAIGKSAFAHCWRLASHELPESLKEEFEKSRGSDLRFPMEWQQLNDMEGLQT